jgi:protease I
MFRSIIISGVQAQDHEFIYPFYRLSEAEIKADVCTIGSKPVKGILGTQLPPNKDYPIKDIREINIDDYDLLVLPGGV